MEHTIYTKNRELFLIMGEVPEKPKMSRPEFDTRSEFDAFAEAVAQYNATISRLKDSAIRVDNKSYKNKINDLVISGLETIIIDPKEGELYPIECEVEIKKVRTWDEEGVCCNECCNGDRCEDPTHIYRKNCPYCKGTGRIEKGMIKYAILKPVARQESQEEYDQDFVWGEFWNVFHHAESRGGRQVAYEAIKRQFHITRR